jgi:hypothetical protein
MAPSPLSRRDYGIGPGTFLLHWIREQARKVHESEWGGWTIPGMALWAIRPIYSPKGEHTQNAGTCWEQFPALGGEVVVRPELMSPAWVPAQTCPGDSALPGPS